MTYLREELINLNLIVDKIFEMKREDNQRLDELSNILSKYKSKAQDLISLRYIPIQINFFTMEYRDIIQQYLSVSNDYRLLMNVMQVENIVARSVREYPISNRKIKYDNEPIVNEIIDLLKIIKSHHYDIDIYERDLNYFITTINYREEQYFSRMLLSRMHTELQEIATRENFHSINTEVDNIETNNSFFGLFSSLLSSNVASAEPTPSQEEIDGVTKNDEESDCCFAIFSSLWHSNRVAPESPQQKDMKNQTQEEENNMVTAFMAPITIDTLTLESY